MSLNLTQEQALTVKQKSRDEVELPSYYSSLLQTDVKISRDFEAYLILTSSELKTTALDWINKAASLQKVNKDRDDLIAMAAEQESTNAKAQVAAIDTKLTDFNSFRTKFEISATFAEIPEVQTLLFDLQRVVEELAAAREKFQFDDTVGQVVIRDGDNTHVSEGQVQQLQSWTKVLSTYI